MGSSRAEFFSYATVSVFGLKGVDKLGKVGKVGNATSKADTTLPYNALKTDKLKETVKANVYANVQQKTEQAAAFWKSNFSKEAINKMIEAAKNSAVMTKAKNTLDSANIKETATKTYEAVVKTPIAKTQAAWEKKKEQLLDMPLPNLRLSPVPLGPTTNMTVREGIEAAQNTVMQMVGNKDGGGERTEDRTILEIKGASQYFSYINEIGKRDDLTTEEKLIKIHEAYSALEQKGDVTVVSDMKFLKPEGFGANGRMIVDWPPKMGFVEESIQSINRDNPLPKNWGRVGGKGGENFTTLPDNNIPYSYDERAIPYLENLSARHVGMFKNESYFDAIDALRNDDFEELNRIATMNEKGQISFAEFLDFKAHYEDFLKNIERSMGDVDATYGLKGKASPWINSLTGERLMEGGAEQIVTPLSAEMLEIIGVIPKY